MDRDPQRKQPASSWELFTWINGCNHLYDIEITVLTNISQKPLFLSLFVNIITNFLSEDNQRRNAHLHVSLTQGWEQMGDYLNNTRLGMSQTYPLLTEFEVCTVN